MKNLFIVFLVVGVFLSHCQAFAKNEKVFVDKNTGVSGTIGPTIPEPLLFDLVRPLGAQKGEIEINTLGLLDLGGADLFTWGPELEFVFSNGYAMEFELPFANDELEELKFALQGTISDDPTNQFIHGWQTIQRVKLNDYFWQSDYLYIHGYKFDKHWSTISLTGVRQNFFDEYYATSLLNNTSVFRHTSSKIKEGVEVNWRFDDIGLSSSQTAITLVPQVHFELGDRYGLQIGAGASRHQGKWHSMFGMRLVLEI